MVPRCLELSFVDLMHQSQRSAMASAGKQPHQVVHQPGATMPAHSVRGGMTGHNQPAPPRATSAQDPTVYVSLSSASSSQRHFSQTHYLDGDPSLPPLHTAAAAYLPQQLYSSHAPPMMRDARGGGVGKGYSPATDLYGIMRG